MKSRKITSRDSQRGKILPLRFPTSQKKYILKLKDKNILKFAGLNTAECARLENRLVEAIQHHAVSNWFRISQTRKNTGNDYCCWIINIPSDATLVK